MNRSYNKIGVYGAGVSSRSVADYFRGRRELSLTLRSDDPCRNPVGAERVLFGERALSDINEEILFLSPTVRRERAELISAKEKGVILSSDAELFFEENTAPVFAVTGSAGKSTTAYLISEVLGRVTKASPPIGNFGSGLCAFLGKYEAYSVELSSFQLNYFIPRAHRAVITNITPNHLDWHTDFEEYASAKMNLARGCDELIIDSDCEELTARVMALGLPVFASVSFGSGGRISSNRRIGVDGDAVYLNGKPYVSLKAAKRRERYNLKNFALTVAATLGYAEADILEEVFAEFSGLKHRCELIASTGKISYISSSIDTCPERTLATLLSLRGKTVAILMGKNKNLPLGALAASLPDLTSGAVLCGEIGRALHEQMSAAEYPVMLADNMDDAVAKATLMMGDEEGQIVLSPAGTSFDSYKSYIERGEDFRRAVKQLLSK